MKATAARGYSLIELMIVIGVGSMAAVGFATFITNMSEQQAFIEAKMDMTTLNGDVRSTLDNPTHCLAAFGAGYLLNPAQLAQASPDGQQVATFNLSTGVVLRPNNTPVDGYAVAMRDLRLAGGTPMPGGFRAALIGTFRASRGKELALQRAVFGNVALKVDGANRLMGCQLAIAGSGGGTSPIEVQANCESLGGTMYQSSSGNVEAYVCQLCDNWRGFKVERNMATGTVTTTPECHNLPNTDGP